MELNNYEERTIERLFMNYIHTNNFEVVSKSDALFVLENFLLDIRFHLNEIYIEHVFIESEEEDGKKGGD